MDAVFPVITDELMTRLDGTFSQKPDASMSQREIDFWIGEQRVIDCIKRWYAEQEGGLS